MPISKEQIQARLAEVRAGLGLSQPEFAERLNVPARTYASWERGEREPSVELLMQLFEVFKIDPLWLLAGPGAASKFVDRTQTELVGQIVTSVEEECAASGKVAGPQVKGKIAELLFGYFANKKSFDREQVAIAVKLAA